LQFTDLRHGVHSLVEWSEHERSIDRFDIAEKQRRKYLVH